MNFLLDNLKHLTTTPKNVEQLKKLVLQLAVQGKLTTQWRKENPDVEPASVLLEKIKAEKEKLIYDKIIKRGKKQTPSSFNKSKQKIVTDWEYPDLDDVAQFIGDGTHQTPTYVSQGRISGIRNVWEIQLIHQIDFNDSYDIELAKLSKWKIVTDDQDF